MAQRPVFIPDPNGLAHVRTQTVDFQWHAGLAPSQKQKSIASLHHAARELPNIERVLEVSSKSVEKLGVALSAFNLKLKVPGLAGDISVECAFQGSKVFENGGPFTDLFELPPRDAKRDERLQRSGRLIGFCLMGERWPLEPQTAFYDWLYLNALSVRRDLSTQLSGYSAFTDIEFNPEKSINCQAYSAALFVSLERAHVLETVIASREAFLTHLKPVATNNARQNDTVQGRLF